MKRCVLFSAWCMLFALFLPSAVRPAAPAEVLPSPLPESEARAPVAPDRTVRVLIDGQTAVMPLEEYLVGVVAGEMPASFQPQALRAQAAAARTYTLYRMASISPSHPEADVCADPGCCQAWLSEEELKARWGGDFPGFYEKIRAAVADTAGTVLTWEGEPILACFHASSPGRTESSRAVWGLELPYLVSVNSPETAETLPGLISTLEISAGELRSAVSGVCPDADFEGPNEGWVGERVLDTGGRVASIRIGGSPVSGKALRSLFGLRSACFTLTWTGESFLFTVEGSGHGAGMSQYGAELMAREGMSWQEILQHYYPGAALSSG